jgi:hypothetical protein
VCAGVSGCGHGFAVLVVTVNTGGHSAQGIQPMALAQRDGVEALWLKVCAQHTAFQGISTGLCCINPFAVSSRWVNVVTSIGHYIRDHSQLLGFDSKRIDRSCTPDKDAVNCPIS